MEIVSRQRFVRMSPQKLRLVVGMIKTLSPSEAVKVLPYINKRGAEPISKAIKTAIADAKNRGLVEKSLIFKEIQVGEGPRLKRNRWVAKGRWHPYRRRMSHIRVVLTTKPQASTSKESEKHGTKN